MERRKTESKSMCWWILNKTACIFIFKIYDSSVYVRVWEYVHASSAHTCCVIFVLLMCCTHSAPLTLTQTFFLHVKKWLRTDSVTCNTRFGFLFLCLVLNSNYNFIYVFCSLELLILNSKLRKLMCWEPSFVCHAFPCTLLCLMDLYRYF